MFWMPNVHKKDCQVSHIRSKNPEKVWEEVIIDLFGPTPIKKHVLVIQDSLSRFPTATTVKSTAAGPVIKALKQLYNAYGNPDSHRTDNGPPFNSAAFDKFSGERDIVHKKVFEYHPQGNPAETFMKPLGKAVKISNYNKEPMEEAIDQLLAAYRATPHPATGVPLEILCFVMDINLTSPGMSLVRKKLNRPGQRTSTKKMQGRIQPMTHPESNSQPLA